MASIAELFTVNLHPCVIEANAEELKQLVQFGNGVDVENDSFSSIQRLLERID